MEGVFIPKEFYKIKEIKGKERDVLAIYKYYTENGKNKCCNLNNTQIADILNVSTRYLRMVKKHLNDLGYIRTDGGIKVTYLGVQVGSTVPQVGSTVPTDRKHSSYQVGSTVPIKQEAQFPHKKEKEEQKKEFKEEGKKATSNFEVLVAALPEEHKTQEKIDYLKDEVITGDMLDRLNKIDINDGGIKENWIKSMIIVLNKKFPVEYYVAPKVEPKKEEHSWWEDD